MRVFKAAMTHYFEEENFQNCFDGYSYEENPLQNVEGDKEQKITSCATQGVINTPHFGKLFNTSVFRNPRFENERTHMSTISIDIEGMQFSKIAEIFLNVEVEVDLHKNERVVLCDQMYLSSDINVTLILEMENCSAPLKHCVVVKKPFCINNSNIELKLIRSRFSPKEIKLRQNQTSTSNPFLCAAKQTCKS